MAETFRDFNLADRAVRAMFIIGQDATKYIYPLPKWGTVTAVDHPNRRVQVEYPDDVGNSTGWLPCLTMTPAATGQTVRVSGPTGRRYVDGIFNGEVELATLLMNGDVTINGTDALIARLVRTNNGQNLILAAGESNNYLDHDYLDGFEQVQAVAEAGLLIVAHPGNWINTTGSPGIAGWAGRSEISIDPAGSSGAGLMTFPQVTGRKINFWSTTYGIGVASSHLEILTGGAIDFLSSGTKRASIESNGDVIAGFGSTGRLKVENTNGGCEIGPNSASFSHLYTDRNAWYFDDEIHVDTGIVTSYNENLQLQDTGKTVVTLNGDLSSWNMRLYQEGTTTGDFDGIEAALRILPRSDGTENNGGVAGITIQSTYSTDRHVHMRVFHAEGDELGFRNYENTAWVRLNAAAFDVVSSRRFKNRIRTARTERGLLDFAVPGEEELAFGQFQKLRPVLFDDSEGEMLWEWAGCPGHTIRTKGENWKHGERTETVVYHETRDECSNAGCNGIDNMQKKFHVCDDFECGGTAEAPCWMHEKHIDRVGLIAEELAEIYPKAVTRDMYGTIKGIDYSNMTVEVINVVQYLIDKVVAQEERLARIEAHLGL